MIQSIALRFTNKIVFQNNLIEETCYNPSENDVKKGLAFLKKTIDCGMHNQTENFCFSAYWQNYRDFENGVITTRISYSWNNQDAEIPMSWQNFRKEVWKLYKS